MICRFCIHCYINRMELRVYKFRVKICNQRNKKFVNFISQKELLAKSFQRTWGEWIMRKNVKIIFRFHAEISAVPVRGAFPCRKSLADNFTRWSIWRASDLRSVSMVFTNQLTSESDARSTFLFLLFIITKCLATVHAQNQPKISLNGA